MHPARTCDPCHLCGQRRTQYCHTATWDNEMKEKLEEISEDSFNHCICLACDKYFKHDVGSEGYVPRWRSENKDNNGFSRCSVKSCTQLSRIIHTNILTRDNIVELLQVKLLNEPQHIITPLCTRHYKEVHRLLHSNDDQYSDIKCHTCCSIIHGITRHCPNPKVITRYFKMNGYIDTQTTEDDCICTACYNHHLFIVQNTKCRSKNEELQAQIQQTPDGWTQPHITDALKLIISKLGNVFLRTLQYCFQVCTGALCF